MEQKAIFETRQVIETGMTLMLKCPCPKFIKDYFLESFYFLCFSFNDQVTNILVTNGGPQWLGLNTFCVECLFAKNGSNLP